MRIVLADFDAGNYYPVCEMHCVWDLLWGALTPVQRITALAEKKFGRAEILVHTNEARLPLTEDMSVQVLSGSIDCDIIVHPLLTDLSQIDPSNSGTVYFYGGITAAIIPDGIIDPSDTAAITSSYKKEELSCKIPGYLFEMVSDNGKRICEDFSLTDRDRTVIPSYESGIFIDNPDNVSIGSKVSIEPFVTFNTQKGPIIVCDDAVITSFTRIEGPAFIGKGVQTFGAKIREGSTIGENCRIGGETEDSVFLRNSNKYHDGFVGHSYIGEWVNIGALATTSDLKNDYSDIDIYLKNRYISTGEIKVGSAVGDHTKISIGSLLNTGSVIGSFSMLVFTGRMTPPHVPSFTRFIKNRLRDEKSPDKVIGQMKRVMSRRGRNISPQLELHIKNLFGNDSGHRVDEINKWNELMK